VARSGVAAPTELRTTERCPRRRQAVTVRHATAHGAATGCGASAPNPARNATAQRGFLIAVLFVPMLRFTLVSFLRWRAAGGREKAPMLFTVENLQTHFDTRAGLLRAVDGVSFALERGRTLAIVGESGSGKSLTGLSILRLVPRPGRIAGGSVRLDGREILNLPIGELRTIRGGRIAMIFQEPMTSLNPLLTIGRQIEEVLTLHRRLSSRDARREAVALLKRVGIAAAAERVHSYPHELSGGMRQRVMIAIALAGEPEVLIADEPTTALDITIQAQILDLLCELQRERGMAMLFITHDLGIVAQIADDVCVMRAGRFVEHADARTLFESPQHPYTRELLRCSRALEALA
jgi:ABC-type dipeptide/oligopeptide/nickel transport system ATPase component